MILKTTSIALFLTASALQAQDLQKLSIKSDAVTFEYSPDEQYLAMTAGSNVNLFNAGNDTKVLEFTGTFKRIKAGHKGDILDIAFNRDGSFMATASADKTIKIWQVPSGEVIKTFEGHTDAVRYVRFVQDDKLLISVSEDLSTRVWEIETGKQVYFKKDFQKAILAFDVTQDGKFFALGGRDKEIIIYETATGSQRHRLSGHKNWIRSLAFSPDGKILASGGDDKIINLWQTDTGAKIKEYPQRDLVNDLTYTADGKYLVAALEISALHFYNLATGLIALKIDEFLNPVLKVAINPNGKEAATIEEFSKEIKFWHLESLHITPAFRVKDLKDKSAPLILVSNPPNITDNRVRIYKDIIDLRGTVTDESGVRGLKINGRETPVRENGNFLIHVPLSIGDNYVNIEVTDINDNIALKKLIITRKNAEGEEYNAAIAKNHLLVVGINNYQYWPKLSNAVKDGNDLAGILMSKYNFEFSNTTVVKDEQATRSNIYNSLRGLIEKISPQDNLVVYFSGHGYFDEVLNEGYWIPADAHVNSSGEYISNTEILKILGNINSQHTFLVADACFSGALFADSRRGYTENVEKFRSRWGLASGRLEVVSDGQTGTNSPFAKRFIQYLQQNDKEKFSVSELIQYVKTQVAEDTNQTPIGNPLRALGDEGGEFVFYKKKN